MSVYTNKRRKKLPALTIVTIPYIVYSYKKYKSEIMEYKKGDSYINFFRCISIPQVRQGIYGA